MSDDNFQSHYGCDGVDGELEIKRSGNLDQGASWIIFTDDNVTQDYGHFGM